MGDLYDNAEEPYRVFNAKVEATYAYQDISGKIMLEKRRLAGKKFLWVYNGEPCRGNRPLPALYCGLSDPVKAAATVYWVEGEKDADNLNLCDMPAVSAPDGAQGKLTPGQLEPLRGKNVIILPDNDAPGHKHAEAVAAALHGIAASVRVLDLLKIDPALPEKDDISDLIEERGESVLGIVREMVGSLPEWAAEEAMKPVPLETTSARDLLGTTFAPLVQAVDRFICEGLTFVTAPSKIGKSWLMLLMARCVANGEPFLDRETTRCRVLYYALEDSKRRLQSRLRTIGVSQVPDNLFFATAAPLLGAGFEEQLTGWLDAEQGPALVIVDTFQKVRGVSSGRINAYQSDYEVVGKLKKIADQHHAMIVCTHHTNKIKFASDPYDKVSGSTGIMGAADTMIMIERERGADTATVRFEGRDTWGADFIIRFNNGVWELESDDAAAFKAAHNYEAEPIVQLFRQLMAENAQGGRWTYGNLQARGLELLGYQPFIDGKDCARILNGGLADDLRKRDGILCETSIRVQGTKGVKIQPIAAITGFQTKFAAQTGR